MNPRPILHALLDTEPLTVGEVREIALRHVVSAPFDGRNVLITKKLLEMYWLVKRDESDMVPKEQVYDLLKQHFVEGFNSGMGRNVPNAAEFWVWPASLPHPVEMLASYPLDFLTMAGLAIGTQVGLMAAKDERLAKKATTSN